MCGILIIANIAALYETTSLVSLPSWGNSDSRHFWTEIHGAKSRGVADNRQHTWHLDYVGLDLGRSRTITRIVFSPRSDDNGIVEGEEYELLSWDGSRWKSQGVRAGTSEGTICFESVPSSALFRIRNLTRGVEDNIFTVEDGRQVYF